MRRKGGTSPVPAELATYDAARWAPLAGQNEHGGSMAYFRALLCAGVQVDEAHRLRAAAVVAELKAQVVGGG